MYSPSSSKFHPASLVSSESHSPALLQLVSLKVSKPLIDYVVECTSETVDYAMGRSHSIATSPRRPHLAKFTTFVTNVLTRAEVTSPTILVCLAYMDRAKPHLDIALEEWALERVFLGALILAAKYLNDSTLRNIHWALCTGVFGKRDVGRIEREFLDVLNWELSISEADILSHHSGISAVVAPSTPSSSRFHHFHHPSHLNHPLPHRNHHRTSCPELDPSSPSSSDGSTSPQTPSTSNSAPESFVPTKPKDAVVSSHPSDDYEPLQSFSIPSHLPIRI
ncbi:hypothetical protein GYMLUDRAFT_37011 [Collybiopsis luxurians FD-317 M1]|nr:hypothetical protein GYMLUDRAFT_37011 [Collybiopsis luxurians FD-317 M1]